MAPDHTEIDSRMPKALHERAAQMLSEACIIADRAITGGNPSDWALAKKAGTKYRAMQARAMAAQAAHDARETPHDAEDSQILYPDAPKEGR